MGCGCNKKKNIKPDQNKGTFTGGKIPETKPETKMPSLAKRAFSFAKSATDYVRSGMENVSETQYQTRLKICEVCTFRKDSTCTKCGCFIEVKAKWATSECPDKRWPGIVLANKKK